MKKSNDTRSKVYKISRFPVNEKYEMSLRDEPYGMQSHTLDLGEKVSFDKVPIFYVTRSNKQLPDNLTNPLSWLVFSKRTVDLLAPLWGDNVQYLDVNVFYDDGGEIDGKYYAINILDVIKRSINLKLSSYFDMGGWKSFVKINLYEKCVIGHHAFKVKESIMQSFFSGETVKIIRKNKLTGFNFYEVPLS